MKLFAEIGKLDNQDYISQLLKNGRMNDTQKKIYEDYKKSLLVESREATDTLKHGRTDSIINYCEADEVIR